MAAEALSLHIAGMQEEGEALPQPSSLDDLRDDPAMRGAVAFLVDVREPEKTIRINITARVSEIAEIDHRARQARLNRSAYMVRRALESATSREPVSVGSQRSVSNSNARRRSRRTRAESRTA
jgi:hypothetical protein